MTCANPNDIESYDLYFEARWYALILVRQTKTVILSTAGLDICYGCSGVVESIAAGAVVHMLIYMRCSTMYRFFVYIWKRKLTTPEQGIDTSRISMTGYKRSG